MREGYYLSKCFIFGRAAICVPDQKERRRQLDTGVLFLRENLWDLEFLI